MKLLEESVIIIEMKFLLFTGWIFLRTMMKINNTKNIAVLNKKTSPDRIGTLT